MEIRGIHSQLSILKDEGRGKLSRKALEINLDGSLSKVDRGPQPPIFLV